MSIIYVESFIFCPYLFICLNCIEVELFCGGAVDIKEFSFEWMYRHRQFCMVSGHTRAIANFNLTTLDDQHMFVSNINMIDFDSSAVARPICGQTPAEVKSYYTQHTEHCCCE